MELAHAGLIADPSEFGADGKNSCMAGGCHETISEMYSEGLHQNLWGEKKWVALRSGVERLDQCPQSTREGYPECTSCHATCGDCHVSVPNSAGKGFISSHRFMKTPNEINNCMACHGSRIGADYTGNYDVSPIRYRDAHSDKLGYTCMNCHDQNEMHGSAPDTTDRYHYNELPSCEDASCHSAGAQLPTKNAFHTVHYNKMSCFVCHSQPYNNCTSCHVENAWQTDPVYQSQNPALDFRIGINPNQTQSGRFRFKYITVRHIPISPDSYANWGAESANLPDYDKYPTWKYTSPHSIRRFTERTQVEAGEACYMNCHTRTGLGDPVNKKYYLYQEYIQTTWPDEVNANTATVVDGRLPAGW